MAASKELDKKNEDTEKAEEQFHKDMEAAKKEADPVERSKKEDEARRKFNKAANEAEEKYKKAKDDAAKKLKKFVSDQIDAKEKHPDKQIDLSSLGNMVALAIEEGALEKDIYKPTDPCKNGTCPQTTSNKGNTINCEDDKTCSCKCVVFVNIGGTEFRAKALIQGAELHSCPSRVKLLFPLVNCHCVEKN